MELITVSQAAEILEIRTDELKCFRVKLGAPDFIQKPVKSPKVKQEGLFDKDQIIEFGKHNNCKLMISNQRRIDRETKLNGRETQRRTQSKQQNVTPEPINKMILDFLAGKYDSQTKQEHHKVKKLFSRINPQPRKVVSLKDIYDY